MLDDGARPWLRALCEKLNCGYIARPDNSHAKAGNINHALAKVAELPNPPQFISILDADFVPMPNFLSRAMTLFRDRPGRHRPDAPAFHQSRSDPDQSVGDARLAGRPAVLLRRRDAGQGRLVGGLLLRHLFDHPVPALARHRRVPDRFRNGRLSADAAHERSRLHDRLSQRAADAWPRARGPQGICHPAQPLVPWLHADRARAQRPVLEHQPADLHGPAVADRQLSQLGGGLSLQAAGADHPDPLPPVQYQVGPCRTA